MALVPCGFPVRNTAPPLLIYYIMKKTKQETKNFLREQYEKACNAYLVELLRLWELDAHYGYWNSDQPGTIYHYAEWHNLTMEEIIYIVENEIPEAEVTEWEEYNLDAAKFRFMTPNLRAWHDGCPRTPKAVFDRLREMKRNLEEAIDAERRKKY